MANRVFLNDQEIQEMILEGDQTRESLFKTIKESFSLDYALNNQGKPIKTIVDLTRVTHLDESAFNLSELSVSSLMYDKLAIYGANEEMKELITQIVGSAKDKSKVKYFDKREDAIAWLM